MLSNLIWLHMLPNKVRQHSVIYRLQSAGVKLSSEAVQGPSLPLQGIHHIHGSHSLPFGVLRVGDGIADDVLQEDLENTPGLLVDESTDPFDATPPCKSTDSRLGDALDVVSQHLAMSLSTSLAQAFASFASRRIAGLVMPWMLSRNTLRCLLAPPLPKPLPPLPLPVMVKLVCWQSSTDRCPLDVVSQHLA